jgi:transposase-like protein
MEDFPRTMPEFEAFFCTEAVCLNFLINVRWPHGVRCAHCDGEKLWQVGLVFECAACGRQTRVLAGTIFQDTHLPLRTWFRAMWWVVTQKNGTSALGLKRLLGLSYRTAWHLLHKLRRAMVRPGRDRLSGRVEVDEIFIGGLEEGVKGRETERKAMVVIAAQEDGKKIGRIRMHRIADASGESLLSFIEESIEPGSTVHTDGWLGYTGVVDKGYRHKVSILSQKGPAVMPRVHRVASLLKRWILGTHQGAVSKVHLDYYLDEFAFRFNRRTSGSRGKLFYRLMQQAVLTGPVPFAKITKHSRPYRRPKHKL